MKKTIAVLGTSGNSIDKKHLELARRVGTEIARRGYVLVCGACDGLPEAAAQGAKAAGGTVIGISPAQSKLEHVQVYHSPIEDYDFICFSGFGYKGRNILIVRSSDAVIGMQGGMGTLNELTAAFDENKLIGILGGMGGVADEFPRLSRLAKRKTTSKIIADSSPEKLVARIAAKLNGRRQPGEDAYGARR